MRLTIAIPTYDDFDGCFFSVNALRLYHDLGDNEILLLDNHPESPSGRATATFAGQCRGGGTVRYVSWAGAVGPANAKDQAVREAAGDFVLVLDSHVLLVPGAVARTLAFLDRQPQTDDLYQGPLLYDNFASISTHFDDLWRGEMWGTWGTDPRGDPNSPQWTGEPFEIQANGCGLFLVRKASWLGFNPDFRGFGGEEHYLHLKYRQAGRKCWCLPWLRWLHRFGRPLGAPYRVDLFDKVRNYIIGHRELGLGLDRPHRHFVLNQGEDGRPVRPGGPALTQEQWDALVAGRPLPAPQPQKAAGCGGCGKARQQQVPPPASLEEAYQRAAGTASDINEHCPKLRELAAQAEVVLELGVRTGVSTAALLAGRPKKLVSVDLNDSPQARALAGVANGTDFALQRGDSRSYGPLAHDLLFIDTRHTADHLWAELQQHAPHCRGRMALHDTMIFGEKGEDGGPGLLPALRRWMTEHPEWSVVYHATNNYGLTVISRLATDKKPLPGRLTMAKNFAKAVAAHVADGARTVTAEQLEARLARCSLCEHRHDTQCSVCGCYVDKKAAWREQPCPLGYWEPLP